MHCTLSEGKRRFAMSILQLAQKRLSARRANIICCKICLSIFCSPQFDTVTEGQDFIRTALLYSMSVEERLRVLISLS